MTLYALFRFIAGLLPRFPSQHELDEAYLADSVDIYDLERRMRDIDQRGRRVAATAIAGFESV